MLRAVPAPMRGTVVKISPRAQAVWSYAWSTLGSKVAGCLAILSLDLWRRTRRRNSTPAAGWH